MSEMTSRPLIIVQARMGGERFPGKVLAPLMGQAMLLWQLARVSVLQQADIVVATPPGEAQRPIWDLCAKHGYTWMAPDVAEEDVLGRYALVAQHYQPAAVIRLTADCPLIDPQVINVFYETWLALWASVSDLQGLLHLGPTAEWPDGQDVEVFSYQALALAHADATAAHEREHVSPYMYAAGSPVRQHLLACPFDLSTHQYSVDTPQDLELVNRIAALATARSGFFFSWMDIYVACLSDRGLTHAMAHRPARNHKYVTQVGGTDWQEVRYGRPPDPIVRLEG